MSQGRLLLIEDERLLRDLVARFLRIEGYEVVEAYDGPSGNARFLSDGPFDLLMVDLNLPGYSGVEVVRRIRESAPTQPILICSAAILDEAEQALDGMAVSAYLTKPYHPRKLAQTVAELIGRSTCGVRAKTPKYGLVAERAAL